MVVLGDDKARLADLRAAVRARLEEDRLTLHLRKAHISCTADDLNLVGYVVFPHGRCLRGDNWRRFARHLRHQSSLYAAGRLDWADIDPGVQSWIGHARHAYTAGLRRRLFAMISFRRGADRAWAGG
ncbi:MAG: hypothetical protein AB7Q01_08210 [Gammaproteobacteria bacterium]